MSLIVSRRGIGGVYPDVVIEERHVDQMRIATHPVEQGADITDHAWVRPAELTLRGAFSPAKGSQVRDAYETLLALQRSCEPFDVMTGKRTYKNMLLESLQVETDKTSENVLLFTARCREIILVRTNAAPAASAQRFPQRTAALADAGYRQLELRAPALQGKGI